MYQCKAAHSVREEGGGREEVGGNRLDRGRKYIHCRKEKRSVEGGEGE